MNIKYNREKCIACGICSARASNIWIVSEMDGKADLCDSKFKIAHHFRILWPDEVDVMRDIVTLCPTRAIQLI